MTNHTAADAARRVNQMAALYEQMAEIQSELKEYKKAAKHAGYDAVLLARWAKAKADDKLGKLAETVMLAHTYGETIAPDLFGVRDKSDEGPADQNSAGDGPNASRRKTEQAAPARRGGRTPSGGDRRAGIGTASIQHDPLTGEITASAAPGADDGPQSPPAPPSAGDAPGIAAVASPHAECGSDAADGPALAAGTAYSSPSAGLNAQDRAGEFPELPAFLRRRPDSRVQV